MCAVRLAGGKGEGEPVKVQTATIENFKRLRFVELKPEGELVVIGGRNGQGKTSVLDALAAALSGSKPKIPMPVRKGAERAEIVVETDNGLRIVQRYTERGTYSLRVTAADGAEYSAGATFLERFYSSLSFDPLAFVRADGKRQVATLARLTGLTETLDQMDSIRARLFEERTAVNRQVRDIEGRARGDEDFAGVPDEPIDVAGLLEKQGEAIRHNEAIEAKRAQLATRRVRKDAADRAVTVAESRFEEARKALKAAEAEQEQAGQAVAAAAAELEAAGQPVDATELVAEVNRGIALNTRVRMKAERRKIEADLAAAKAEAERLTYEIGNLDADREQAIAKAEYPVPGLAFTADGVTLSGIPLEQASSAEQLRVAVGIGLALNPELRVLLIRDGSLLDDDSLAVLQEMAEKHDVQMFIERVGVAGASVVIEDGEIAGNG